MIRTLRRYVRAMVRRGAVVPILIALSVFVLAEGGEVRVRIVEYDVPTPNARPHDPAAAPDGSLWFTGQQNILTLYGRSSPVLSTRRAFTSLPELRV